MFVCRADEKAFLDGKECNCEIKGRSKGLCEICGYSAPCVDHTCYKKKENK